MGAWDFDRLKIKILRNYRPGIEFGRRMSSTRIIQPAYLKAKYYEYSLCLTLSYSPWNEFFISYSYDEFQLGVFLILTPNRHPYFTCFMLIEESIYCLCAFK